MKSKIKKIYFDMDGVLANFDKWMWESHGIDSTNEVNRFRVYEVLKQEIVSQKIFESLPEMDDFQEMRRLIKSLELNYDVEILTATGKIETEHVENQKKNWLIQQGLGTLKVNTVRESSKKGIYGNETSLLIDDRMKCITPFRNNGGIGIFHEGFFSTYQQIQEFVTL